MAAAVPTNPDLDCCICMDIFKTPKMLSCGHSFCRDCLERWIDGRNGTFPCPFCKQHIQIPRGGVDKFPTNFSLKTLTDSTSHKLKHYCPNHSKKEVEYYCQTCNLGLCYKCILKDHKDHKILDLECDSTKEKMVEELSKSEQFVKKKIKDLENNIAALLETSDKLKSFCDKACRKISQKTKKIIGELKENCEKRQQEIRDNFDKNESKLTDTRQKVMTQIENIEIDLDASRPTTEKPTLTLIYSLPKLKELQKFCENMKTEIPPVTYVEWREGSVNVCDILGSTVTKPLYQSNESSGPVSTVTKPLYQFSEGSVPISTVTKPQYQSSEGSGPISTVTKPLYQSREGSVFRFNYKDIKDDSTFYYSIDKYTSHGMVWNCKVWRSSYYRCLDIGIVFFSEDNLRVWSYNIQYTLTLVNKNKDKNVISKTMIRRFIPGNYMGYDIKIPWDKLSDLSEGFINNEGQFLVRFDILQVIDIQYK